MSGPRPRDERSENGRSIAGIVQVLAIFGACAGFSSSAAPPNPPYTYYEVGDVTSRTRSPASPGLLLAGGGDWDERAFRWFAARAGHGHIVIISASGGADAGEQFYRKISGITSAQTIEFHDRTAAYDPKVLAILRHADGIFILGGDQSKYVRFWRKTPVGALLDQFARSKPIGATSAGLAILGAAGYGAMDGGSIDSAAALSDPTGPAVTIVYDFLHMPFLSHVITDTHFSARHRLGRLIAFVARVRSSHDPNVMGLGIDQGSALTIDDRGNGHFYSKTRGFAWVVNPEGVSVLAQHQPLNAPAVRITGLGEKGSIDFRTFKVSHPAFSVLAAVRDGKLISPPRPKMTGAER